MEPRGTQAIGIRTLANSILLAAIWTVPAFSDTTLRSGPQQVAMVELFTSQGCSSCPPADRWMSDLTDRKGLWTDYVPLAFHVDYWDYIGWKDRFASPHHSSRQRRHAEEGGVDFVYTPGFLVDGREWRQWRGAAEPHESGVDAGLLSVDIESGETTVKFAPSQPYQGQLVATVATLGFGLESDVVAGENGGHKLLNDFVVLGLNETSMSEEHGSFNAVLGVPKSNIRTARRAVVVWISTSGSQKPLQAAGGWYPDKP